MLLLVNNVHEKNITESGQTKFWKRLRAICNLHSCYNFALLLHENSLIFSQSEVHNFSICIIRGIIIIVLFWSSLGGND